MKRKQLMQLYIEREIIRRRCAPALDHSRFWHRIKSRVYLDQLEMLRVPAEALARRHLLRIPLLDKTRVRPARRPNKNFSAHTSTKSRCRQKQLDWRSYAALIRERNWLRGLDLNQRPSGYEPDELPGCSTPRFHYVAIDDEIKLKTPFAETILTNSIKWLQR